MTSGGKKESIFKNSRLMLHEIISKEQEEERKTLEIVEPALTRESLSMLAPSQRLEVVKITRCKMKQKETLEIEIGLKNLQEKKRRFEDRVFMLKFLDKLDPQLSCKGYLLLKGAEILSL